MVTPRPGPPPTVAGRSFRADSSVLDPRARATCRLAPAPRPPRWPRGAVRRPRPGRHAPATLRGVGVPLSVPLPQLADGPLVTVNGAAVSVCVERAGPPATRHTVGRCPGPARRGRGRGLCRHVPGPRPSPAQPCPPPSCLGAGVGRGGGCPLSLWEGQTRGLGGRAGMTHHRDRCLYRLKVGSSVVAVSSSWVLPTEPAACESPRDRGRACRGPAR